MSACDAASSLLGTAGRRRPSECTAVRGQGRRRDRADVRLALDTRCLASRSAASAVRQDLRDLARQERYLHHLGLRDPWAATFTRAALNRDAALRVLEPRSCHVQRVSARRCRNPAHRRIGLGTRDAEQHVAGHPDGRVRDCRVGRHGRNSHFDADWHGDRATMRPPSSCVRSRRWAIPARHRARSWPGSRLYTVTYTSVLLPPS